MPLIDSRTGKTRKQYSVEQLKEAANLMRGYSLVALAAAGSGHSGGTLSIMDIAAVLYLYEAKHDPADPHWPDRDRVFWSAGHKAPAIYAALGMSGYFNIEEMVLLRKLYSPFQGHPHWLKLEGLETSSGSLGQGLSISIGDALNARLDKKDTGSTASWGMASSRRGRSGKRPWKPATIDWTTSAP
jgi:transketolase